MRTRGLMKTIFVVTALVFLGASSLWADSATEVKGKDYTVKIVGDKIVFTLTREGVTKASLPGTWNNWKPEDPAAQMKKTDAGFVLELDVEMFASKTPTEFKFHTDGKWDEGNNQILKMTKKDGKWIFGEGGGDAKAPKTDGGDTTAPKVSQDVDMAALKALPEKYKYEKKDYTVYIWKDKVVFVLRRDGVEKAAVPGFMNEWKPDAPEAQMTKKGDAYVLVVPLTSFVTKNQEFKFHVNGKWDEGGNKVLNIKKKKGEYQFVKAATDKVNPNTKASDSIEFHGRTSAFLWYEKQEVDNNYNDGDGGFYFSQSDFNLDLMLDFKVGKQILGHATLTYNFNVSGDQTLYLEKYDTQFFLDDDFKMRLFFGKGVTELLNPLRSLDKFSRTMYNPVIFYGESGGDAMLFGRYHLGGLVKANVIGGEFYALLAREKLKDYYNDVIAGRYARPILPKLLDIGITYTYERYPNVRGRNEADFFAKFDPNRVWENFYASYTRMDVGADVALHFGEGNTVFAEIRSSSMDMLLNNTNVITNEAKGAMTICGGVKMDLGGLKAEARVTMMNYDEALTTNNNLMDIRVKAGFGSDKSLKAAIAFGFQQVKNSDSAIIIRLDGKYISNMFDGYVSSETILQGGNINSDNRLWVEWYFNAKTRGLLGARMMMYKDDQDNDQTYINPYLGIRHDLDKSLVIRGFLGLNPQYDIYREDKEQTIGAQTGVRDVSLNPSYANREDKLKRNLRLNLEVDAKF